MSVHAALLKFSSEFSGAHKTGVNPHFNSQHFTLDDVVKATTPLLAKHGLYTSHQAELIDGVWCMTTTIRDESGDSIKSSLPMSTNSNPQVLGSAVTYFKRYNLCALLNIAEADDDANAVAASLEPITAEQAAQIREHVEALEINEAKFLQYLGVDTVDDIPASKLKAAMLAIERKRKAA